MPGVEVENENSVRASHIVVPAGKETRIASINENQGIEPGSTILYRR